MQGDFERYSKIADILKALAHPVRLCIVSGLIEAGVSNVGNMRGCLDMPQSTTSQHLQKLKAMGIVESRREGLEVYYRVQNPFIIELVKVIENENLRISECL